GTAKGAWAAAEAIARGARAHGALIAIDCVASLGGIPLEGDASGVDAAGTCSQKCLGAPPGLGPVTLGPRAIDPIRRRRAKPQTFYFDVSLVFQYWGEAGGAKERVFHHTAPVAMVYALRGALRLALAEGLEARC